MQTRPRPATWPARYRLHKWWSRKPGDRVAAAIAAATAPGALVVDPFCGSGVAPLEARLLGRRAIGADLNPFAVRLAAATAARCDPETLLARGRAALAAARAEEEAFHRARCPGCGAGAALAAAAWEGDALVAVDVRCVGCRRTARRPADAADRALVAASDAAGDGGAPRPPVPRGWQTRKLVRAGIADFGGLFTARSLRALAAFRRHVLDGPDDAERELLLLVLTGALAQASRMMADHSRAGGGHSWKLNIFWLPERSLELDPFRCLENRLVRVVQAKRETEALLAAAPPAPAPAYHRADARRLLELVGKGSVDHVFADPPYGGEGIQYGELSLLWCGWLEPAEAPDLDAEIGENPHRGRDAGAFAAGLADAFGAIREALRPDGRVTVTFASRDRRAWAALEAALDGAGLAVVGREALGRSAPGLTEIVSAGAPRADVWLDCVPARRRRG